MNETVMCGTFLIKKDNVSLALSRCTLQPLAIKKGVTCKRECVCE